MLKKFFNGLILGFKARLLLQKYYIFRDYPLIGCKKLAQKMFKIM